MPEHASHLAAAFARLERALLRRRLAAIEPILRVEIVALGAFASALLFWQARLRIDSLAFARGPAVAAAAISAALLGLALLGGALAGGRLISRLGGRLPGPHWLALPIPPLAILRHHARGARLLSLWAAPPGMVILIAGAGIVPAPWLAALGVGFAAAFDLAGRAGCAVAFRIALRRCERRPGQDPVTRVLAAAARPVRGARLGRARWRGDGALRAFLRKDLLVTRRPGAARERIASPLALGVFSILAWMLPVAPEGVATVAFAVAILSAVGLATWIVGLAASDPSPVVRTLPLGVGVVWGARVVWAALGALALGAGQALALGFGPAHPPGASFTTVALIAFAIGTLGANYAVTLHPRSDHADRVLGIALAISLAASLMMYYMGWLLLVAGLLLSARRLPRWSWQENE